MVRESEVPHSVAEESQLRRISQPNVMIIAWIILDPSFRIMYCQVDVTVFVVVPASCFVCIGQTHFKIEILNSVHFATLVEPPEAIHFEG